MRPKGTSAPALERGDWVYVDPAEPDAPRELLGLAGLVSEVEDGRATVAFRGPDTVWTIELEIRMLRVDRRRRNRTPAHWSGDGLVATG